jgi:hypothetical protein
MSKTIDTVGIYLSAKERHHLSEIVADLESKEEKAIREFRTVDATDYAEKRAALTKLMYLPASREEPVVKERKATLVLTDDELEAFEYHGCSSGTDTPPLVRNAIVRATQEIRHHRAAIAADKGRVRAALVAAIDTVAIEGVDRGRSSWSGAFTDRIAELLSDALALPKLGLPSERVRAVVKEAVTAVIAAYSPTATDAERSIAGAVLGESIAARVAKLLIE